MQETLPSKQDLYYLVDKLPSGTTQKIWRRLIDRSKIAAALNWLKQNNPLYYDTVVKLAEFVDPELHESAADDLNPEESDPELDEKSMLLHEEDKYASTDYTLDNVS